MTVLRTALVAVALVLALCGAADARTDVPASEGVPILMYHHIGRAPDGAAKPPLWVSARLFARQLDALERAGYTGVTLGQVWRYWHKGGSLPAKPIVLTFDDGFTSQYSSALPAMRAHGWPGVLNLWVDRLDARGGLSRSQIQRMIGAGWEIDAHSMSHPDLRKLDAEQLEREVSGSREAIRRAFGVPADFFAYPYGAYDETVKAAVRAAGFVAAEGNKTGLASPKGDPLVLPRILANGRRDADDLLATLRRARPRTRG